MSSNKTFEILFKNENLVVIDKPSGFHVHPPESYRVPREQIILQQLRDQIEQKIFPVHRLDAGTSGVLAFALNSEMARVLCDEFEARRVQKTYWAVVRGHSPAQGVVDSPLESDTKGELQAAETHFRTLKRVVLPFSVGKSPEAFPTSRYSWVEVYPKTGRFHQIRRHLNRISHPIVGDADHGDSRHNGQFREKMGVTGLCLRSVGLEFPALGLGWKCGLNKQWTLLQNIFEAGETLETSFD